MNILKQLFFRNNNTDINIVPVNDPGTKQLDNNNVVSVNSIIEEPFDKYDIAIKYDDNKIVYKITDINKENMFLEEITKLVNERHAPIDFLTTNNNIIKILTDKFEVNLLTISPKIMKKEVLPDGTHIIEYMNGVIEMVTMEYDEYTKDKIYFKHGTRFYPNGKKECGDFLYGNKLQNGYSVQNGEYIFYHPHKLCNDIMTGVNFVKCKVDNKPTLFAVNNGWDKCTLYDGHAKDVLIKMVTSKYASPVVKKIFRHPYRNKLIDVKEFVIEVTREPNAIILSFTQSDDIIQILDKIRRYNITISFDLINQLFNKWVAKGYCDLIKKFIAENPNLINDDGSYFVKCVLNGQSSEAFLFIGADTENWSTEPKWIRRAFLSDLSFSYDDFNNLDSQLKNKMYEVANMYNYFALVDKLNGFGMEVPEKDLVYKEGPYELLAYNMDSVRVRNVLFEFVKQLRSDGLLLYKNEYDNEKFGGINKSNDFSRLLGKRYVDRIINELKIKHIKTPIKIIVLEKETNCLTIDAYCISFRLENDITVYAKYIKSVERNISREEFEELILLMERVCYHDIRQDQFIIAEDGIYFIDTEAGPFCYKPNYSQMFYLVGMLDEIDYGWGKAFIQSRYENYREKKTKCDVKKIKKVNPFYINLDN